MYLSLLQTFLNFISTPLQFALSDEKLESQQILNQGGMSQAVWS